MKHGNTRAWGIKKKGKRTFFMHGIRQKQLALAKELLGLS